MPSNTACVLRTLFEISYEVLAMLAGIVGRLIVYHSAMGSRGHAYPKVFDVPVDAQAMLDAPPAPKHAARHRIFLEPLFLVRVHVGPLSCSYPHRRRGLRPVNATPYSSLFSVIGYDKEGRKKFRTTVRFIAAAKSISPQLFWNAPSNSKTLHQYHRFDSRAPYL